MIVEPMAQVRNLVYIVCQIFFLFLQKENTLKLKGKFFLNVIPDHEENNVHLRCECILKALCVYTNNQAWKQRLKRLFT